MDFILSKKTNKIRVMQKNKDESPDDNPNSNYGYIDFEKLYKERFQNPKDYNIIVPMEEDQINFGIWVQFNHPNFFEGQVGKKKYRDWCINTIGIMFW